MGRGRARGVVDPASYVPTALDHHEDETGDDRCSCKPAKNWVSESQAKHEPSSPSDQNRKLEDAARSETRKRVRIFAGITPPAEVLSPPDVTPQVFVVLLHVRKSTVGSRSVQTLKGRTRRLSTRRARASDVRRRATKAAAALHV